MSKCHRDCDHEMKDILKCYEGSRVTIILASGEEFKDVKIKKVKGNVVLIKECDEYKYISICCICIVIPCQCTCLC